MKRAWGILAGVMAFCAFTCMAADPKKEDDQKSHPVFAFVALKKLSQPTPQEVEKALKSSLPEGSKIEHIEVDDKAVTFEVNGMPAMIGSMDFPIPWGDLEGPCATCWHWKEATEQMKLQKAHVIVMLLGEKGPQIDRCVLLTKLLSATTKMFDAVGVYWGHGSVVLSVDELQKMAATATVDDPPLMAWIEFRIQKNDDGTCNVLTTGLDYFSCMEIEVMHSSKKPTEVLNMVMGTAYLLLKGEKFKDGDTVGPDADTKIKTHYAKSVWDRPAQVLKIDM